MRVAVTFENGQVFQHFGHSKKFKLYDIEDGKVLTAVVISAGASGHGALAGMLQGMHVDALICGGIGGGAQTALAEAGIRLYAGVQGGADEAVQALISGNLNYDPDAKCDHHDHDHEHQCGEHSCGGSCH